MATGNETSNKPKESQQNESTCESLQLVITEEEIKYEDQEKEQVKITEELENQELDSIDEAFWRTCSLGYSRQFGAPPLCDIWSRFRNKLLPILESEEDENKENIYPSYNKSAADNSSQSPCLVEQYRSMVSRHPLSTLFENTQHKSHEKKKSKKNLFHVTEPSQFQTSGAEEDTKSFEIFETGD